jgi:hypothetical protein
MKLEWGKKVYCPACSLPFYDMRRSVLLCPNCGNSFSGSELYLKKSREVVIDDVSAEDDKISEIPNFGFDACAGDIDLVDDTTTVDELNEIKKIDTDS